jgi:hypothetical protein
VVSRVFGTFTASVAALSSFYYQQNKAAVMAVLRKKDTLTGFLGVLLEDIKGLKVFHVRQAGPFFIGSSGKIWPIQINPLL